LVLALIVAVAGFMFNSILQHQKTSSDYQKTIFDRRVDAYVAVLEQARAAQLELAVFYGGDSIGWQKKFDNARRRAEALGPNPIGLGGESGWSTYDDVIKPLESMERIRREKSLYFSKPVDESVDRFLSTVWADIELDLSNSEQSEKDRVKKNGQSQQEQERMNEFRRAVWERARASYDELDETIRERLRVKLSPV
jgi:hypothetical protein